MGPYARERRGPRRRRKLTGGRLWSGGKLGVVEEDLHGGNAGWRQHGEFAATWPDLFLPRVPPLLLGRLRVGRRRKHVRFRG